MAIDVGPPATDQASSGDSYTIINATNPANATGTIDHIEIYGAALDATGDQVGSYFLVSGTSFTSRGNTDVDLPIATGLNEYDAPGDFAAFAINITDYIGFHQGEDDTIDRDIGAPSGDGCWYKTGDYCPCTNEAFEYYDADYSVSATGIELGGVAPTGVFCGPLVGSLGGPI